MRRHTELVVRQRPGTLLLRVTARSIDGEVYTSYRYTWLGRLLQWLRLLPDKPEVTVIRARELVLHTDQRV